MAAFEQIGVQAVVQGMSEFQRDMTKISTMAQEVNKDTQRWAQAQSQGMSQGAAAADALATKYAKLAEQQRSMALYWTSKGKFDVAQQHIKEADALGTLASRYREVADAQKGVGDGQNKMSALSDMVQAKWAQLAAAGAVLVAGMRGIQQFFAMGAEGAAVQQTAVSFERLMKILGAAPDVLAKMREATQGTVDDTQLMSSVMTVLAGGSEEVNKAIVAAIPQLLAMAKASNTLNPSLGSTAYLFDSLTRGIKRNSPMILDNLGIVVKIGPAHERYAESIGKTVEQLTEEENVIALLNAALAAGDNLIAQVGGTTESLVDPTARLDAALKNLGDTLKTGIAGPAANAADGLVSLLTGEKKVTAAIGAHEAEVRAGAKSYEEYRAEMERTGKITQRSVATQAMLTNEHLRGRGGAQDFTNAIIILDEASWIATQRAKEAPEVYADVGKAIVNAGLAAANAAANVAPMSFALTHLRDRARETSAAFDSVNTNLGKTIQTLLTNIAWVQGGGADLQAAADSVMTALKQGVITPGEAQALLEPIGLAALALEQELGLITVPDAAQQGADLLKVSLQDGAKAVEAAKTTLTTLPAQVQTSIKVAVDWYLRKGPLQGGYAHGGQFTVGGKGGTDTTPVHFMASPGEIVTVTPPGRSSSMEDNRSVNVGNVNVNNGMSAQAFDTMMRSWLGA